MFSKVLSSIIILVVLYILGIFLAPVLTDSIGESLGIREMNEKIRSFKTGVDSTSDTLLQIKDASGAINGVRGVVNATTSRIEETKSMIDTKVQQVNKTVDSVQKAGQAINEVQNNISELTSLSGSVAQSGSTKSGSGK